MLSKKVGACIRTLRKLQGLSQEELAHQCKVHRTYIGMVERGEKNITINTLDIVAKALGKKAYEIIRDAENGE